MRIVFWSDLFPPYVGGVETQASGLLPALREFGHELSVVTSHRDLDLPDREDWNGFPVYRLHCRRALKQGDPAAFLGVQRHARKLVRDITPEVIHLYGVGPSAAYCRPIADAHPGALLLSLHQELRPSQREADSGTLLSRLLQRADWVHAVSPAVLRQATDQAPVIRARSSVIANFVEPPVLSPAPLPTRPTRLLCLGRVIPQKGFDIAVRAFAVVLRRFPDVRLTIAGDGVQRLALEREARSLGIAERVEFIGMAPHESVFALIDQCFAVLMPSRFEGFGVVALEAAVMARPVVATAVGGLRELVQAQRTGLLVPAEDPEALAAAIGSLLENPHAAARMGARARRRALAAFGKEAAVGAFDALYRRLDGNR